MSRKGENIFHRKDGRWEARYIKEIKNNKSYYGYVYGKTYLEVKNKRKMILLNLEENRKNINSRILLSHKIDEWLEYKKNTIKLSTYSYYLRITKKHIKPHLGNIIINKIDDNIISNYTNLKIEEGLSNSTVKEIIIILKQILDFSNIKVNIKLPKIEKNRIKTLSNNDKKRLELYISNNINETTIGILFSLYCGLRIGEVCGLKWKDINFQTNTLIVQRTVSRVANIKDNQSKTCLIISSTKTNNSLREIPIHPSFMLLLKKLKKNNTDLYILSSNDKCLDPRSYYNKYKKILKYAGINNYKYHSLRHTFATTCIELGLDPKSLSELLGHSDIKITLSLYVHPSLELKRKFINNNLQCLNNY